MTHIPCNKLNNSKLTLLSFVLSNLGIQFMGIRSGRYDSLSLSLFFSLSQKWIRYFGVDVSVPCLGIGLCARQRTTSVWLVIWLVGWLVGRSRYMDGTRWVLFVLLFARNIVLHSLVVYQMAYFMFPEIVVL